jgi:DNA-binding transcriptional MerR regulator
VKIGEVARRAEVTIDTIRFYERRGVLPAPARRPSGYREYTDDTVQRIQLARRMQSVGLTLDEVIDALSAHDAGEATCESERWRLDAALDRVDARIAELKALRREIVSARTACESGHCSFVGATSGE